MTKNKTVTVEVLKYVGTFAEDKDAARELRRDVILPALEAGNNVVLDFSKVESATQSFIHALISELIRRFGIGVLDKIAFKGCNETIKKIISIVTEYMQHAEEPTKSTDS
jgi:uncharacterized protein DUF4325